MSKRLQVLLDEQDLEAIREIADRHGMTVSEWVRGAIRAARREESATDPAAKLEAIRAASEHAFPTAPVDQMLDEIERGYLEDGPE